MDMANTNYGEFAKDITTALKEVADKYGVDFKIAGNFTYEGDNSAVRFRMQATNRKADGTSVDPYMLKLEKAFNRYAFRYDLEGQLGATFKHNGNTMKIVGMKPQSKKQPIVVCDVDCPKNLYKYPAGIVQDGLGIERTPVDFY